METQQVTPAALPQNNSKSFSPIVMPQPMILKSVNESGRESSSSPLLASDSYIPPGLNYMSSLNSLALNIALRLPISVAYSAPVAVSSPSESSGPLAQFTVAAPSMNGTLTLNPYQHFPLATPLQIPHRRPLRHNAHFPSLGQVLDIEEDEETLSKSKWWHSTVSGVVGGFCCVYAGQPFDTVKVRLQTQGTNKIYNNPIDCLRKTVTQGGYRALYKGSTAALASVVLENAVLFTANSAVKDGLKSYFKTEGELTLGQEALAGGIAGFFSSSAITPAEVIKCRLQIQDRTSSASVVNSPLRYSGPLDAFKKIYRSEGLKGIFAGLPSVWMRDIPFNFVFLGSYEAFCSLSSWKLNKQRDQLGVGELFVCGGLAGVSGWSLVFPMDVVKSKMQTSPTKENAFQVIKSTFKTGGVRAFYQGWSAAVLRAFPANAALLMGVEMSRRFFEKMGD